MVDKRQRIRSQLFPLAKAEKTMILTMTLIFVGRNAIFIILFHVPITNNTYKTILPNRPNLMQFVQGRKVLTKKEQLASEKEFLETQ